jgi:Uma2 family endonuclease
MAAAPDFLSLKEFEDRYIGQKPNYEYWFGEAIQKSMPTSLHGFLQFILMTLISRAGWATASEVRLKISRLAHPVPDVVADRTRIEDPYPTTPLDLCVEIISPGDVLREVFVKAGHYLDWGIGTVWVIDGYRRTAYSMSLEQPAPVETRYSDSLVAGSGEHSLAIPLSEVFAELDKALSR